MNAIKDAALQLETTLKTLKLPVVRPGAQIVDPPALVLGPPKLAWEAYNRGPTSAVFEVIVAVGASEDAMALLWGLVPTVAEAIDAGSPSMAVTNADPVAWPAGGSDLPAYRITVEAEL